MRKHILSFYTDNFVKVEFCKVCGAEGELLRSECSGEFPHEKDTLTKDFFDVGVDNRKEQT